MLFVVSHSELWWTCGVVNGVSNDNGRVVQFIPVYVRFRISYPLRDQKMGRKWQIIQCVTDVFSHVSANKRYRFRIEGTRHGGRG